MCVTYQEFIDFDTCLFENICQSQARVELELQVAMDLIEEILCRKLCPEQICLNFDGSGTEKLFIEKKVHTLTEIRYNNIVQDTLPEIDGRYLYFEDCRKFPCGTNNITVCGTFGGELTPNLKKAIFLLTYESLSPGSVQTGQEGVEIINWGDVNISYSDLKSETGMSTGVVEVDRILSILINAEDLMVYGVVGGNKNCVNKCSCNQSECECDSC